MKNFNLGNHHDVPIEGHYDNVDHVNDSRDLTFINNAGLSFHTRIVNLTYEDIIVKDRAGLEVLVEPVNTFVRRHTLREVQVYEHYGFGHYTTPIAEEMRGPITDVPVTKSSEVMKRDIETVTVKRQGSDFRKTETGYDRVATKGVLTLERLRDGVYLPSIDKIIYLANSTKVLHHPYSEEGKLIRKKYGDKLKNHFGMTVEIFDKDSIVSCRYINVNGYVFKIPINRTGLEENGISVTYSGDDGSFTTNRYSIDEGTKALRLYGSREEAETYGDLKEVEKAKRQKTVLEREKELEDAKFENQERAAENKRTEHMYDEAKMHNEKEASDDKFKKEAEKREAEHKAAMRKYAYEFIKILPSLITATLTLIILLKKK